MNFAFPIICPSRNKKATIWREGKEICPFGTDPFRCTTLHNSMSPTGPTLIKYRNIFLISLPTCCKCLRYVTCMLLCRLWHMCFPFGTSQSPNLPVQTCSRFQPCVNSFQFREVNVAIKLVPSSGRPDIRNDTGIVESSLGKVSERWKDPKSWILFGEGTYYIATHFIL